MKMTPARVALLTLLAAALSSGQVTLNSTATRALGQDSTTLSNVNPNLVEGREFYAPQSIAVDPNSNPAAIYVADTGNNRVLAFHSAQTFTNGQTADLVIGQPNLATTFPEGAARTSLTTGLASPTGLAVDAAGNLYVVDSGNNRILRFPAPFAQPGSQPLPDMAIGQISFAVGTANQGGTTPTAATLSFNSTNSSGTTGAAAAQIGFDPAGNLWVADIGNNRILRFNASVLKTGASNPSADLVLGQSNFTTGTYTAPGGSDPLLSTTAVDVPKGLVFDSAGRLFVEEAPSTRRGRVLIWTTQTFNGQPASRLLAVDEATPQPPTISSLQIGSTPGFLFAIGASVGIVDSVNSRILIYSSLDQWNSTTTDQPPLALIGQTSYTTGTANQGLPQPTASTISFPTAATVLGSEIYIVDSGNERVIVMPELQPGPTFGPATRVLGQDGFSFNSPNLIEGREFFFSTGSSVDAGIAVDINSNPPHLYVADTYNNRILGYNDIRSVKSGQKADIVIGQPGFQTALINYPTNLANPPNSSGLYLPIGLAVDPAGNLYVADTGNGRVLRFPAPFSNYTAGSMEQADLVLGQTSFTNTITDATQRTMAAPYGLALTTATPGLVVSDVAQNRILFFKGASTDFTSGMPATIVLGQNTFNTTASGSGQGQLSGPHHISTDSADRLYVADTGNARVSIWGTVSSLVSGAPAAQFLTANLSSPRGVYVSPINGEIWVSDGSTNNCTRYASFTQLLTNGVAPNATISELAPNAIIEDPYGNLFVADYANRVAIYYPGLGASNAASFLYPYYLTPGMITAVFSQGNATQFGTQGVSAPANQFPLPTVLNGVEVMINGTLAPLFYAGPTQINFMVPNGAPQSGIVDLQIIEAATGRTLGDTNVAMLAAVPGLFSQNGSGSGLLAAVNKDGTVNTSTNPALQGDPLQIFGTGVGYVPNAPIDGYAPTAATSSPLTPTVIIGFAVLTSDQVLYSGLAPGEVGVWQLNVTIPPTVVPSSTSPTYVEVLLNNYPSGGPALGRPLQIYVKQKP